MENLVTVESHKGKRVVLKRFFGTTTPGGAVNFIDSITEDLNKRYFIKGRPGTGKSTFLKKLSKSLTEKGYDIEQYYCSFDPKSLDMVVCRELCFCVFCYLFCSHKSGGKAFKEAVNIENKEYLSQFEKVKAAADIKLLF